MFDFLQHADIYLQTFWYIAMPVTLIFILQSIMTLVGIGDMDSDHDTGGDYGDHDSPMELFTLRNIINFLLGFSWAGISFYNTINNKFLLVTTAISVGVIFVALFFYILQQFRKLEEDNSFNVQDIKGKEAEVYLRLPPAGQGIGKIQVSHNGSIHEIDAVAKSESLATGDKVMIMEVLPGDVVVVERL